MYTRRKTFTHEKREQVGLTNIVTKILWDPLMSFHIANWLYHVAVLVAGDHDNYYNIITF